MSVRSTLLAAPGRWRIRVGSLLLAGLLPFTAATQPSSMSPEAAASAVPFEDDIDVEANDMPFEGRVAAYALSPDAGVAGLIFDNGRQVSIPPHLGDRLVALIQPGQQARVGARRDAARGPGSTRSITAIASGESLVDTASEDARSPPPGRAGAARPLLSTRITGTVRLRLHGPRGETNGLLLDTGAQVFFPPYVAIEAGSWLRPGAAINVSGYGCTSSYGTVVQATRLTGPGGAELNVYGPPGAPPRRR